MLAEFSPVVARYPSVRKLYGSNTRVNFASETKFDLTCTPTLPPEIFERLPSLLKTGCGAFEDQRKKDIFLLTGLTVLSGTMPTVHGLYDGKVVHANLYVFIIAPPASGKSAMLWGQRLGTSLDAYKREQGIKARKEHEMRRQHAAARKELFLEEEPPLQLLFIPGNASASAFMHALKDNGEIGIMVESEADVLASAFKQDWGNFSHLLRQAFHHEPASSLRNGTRLFFERPALSIALSGTAGQVTTLLQSTENGLFSRFMYYTFSTPIEWRNVAPDGVRPILDELFNDLANLTLGLARTVDTYPKIRFDFTPTQWQMFNGFCEEWLTLVVAETSDEMSSVVFRHGLIIYRIALVLSVVRAYERRSLSDCLICHEYDFEVALKIGQVLIEHATAVFEMLPGKQIVKNNQLVKFYETLPSEFSRDSANQIGNAIDIKVRTITTYLKQLVKKGMLRKVEHGKYHKVILER